MNRSLHLLLLTLAACAGESTKSDAPVTDTGGASAHDPTSEDSTSPSADDSASPQDTGCATRLWYRDLDGDGYGHAADSLDSCEPPEGYVAGSGDCDDQDPQVHPSAEESCDQRDEDCDGLIDDGLVCEACDGLDDDGDGLVDEGYDVDGDGVIRCCTPSEDLMVVNGAARFKLEVWRADADMSTTRELLPLLDTGNPDDVPGARLVIDVDGDGNHEVITNDDTSGLVLHTCEGEWTRVPLAQQHLKPKSKGDMNTDGCVDIIAWEAGHNPSYGEVWLGDCLGGFVAGESFSLAPLESTYRSVDFANAKDLNGDGHLDLMFGRYAHSGAAEFEPFLLAGDGAGALSEPEALPALPGQPQNRGTLGDVSGDGCVDWVGGPDDDGARGMVFMALGDCAGGFDAPTAIADACPESCTGNGTSWLNDWDGDGDLDLVVAVSIVGGESAEVWFYENQGAGAFGAGRLLMDDSQVAGTGLVTPTH